MLHKSFKNQKGMLGYIADPSVSETVTFKESSSNNWNPNIPFIGTQEEWWEHFHQIEQGEFYPVSEVHQRVSQWLDNQR